MSLLLRVHDVSQVVEPAVQHLTGRRVRGRRILDVSEIEAENTVSEEIDELLAVRPKIKIKNVEPVDLLAQLPVFKYAKSQNIDAPIKSHIERKAKKKARETEIAILLMDFLD